MGVAYIYGSKLRSADNINMMNLLAVLALISSFYCISLSHPQPSVPAWPSKFTIDFDVYIKSKGNDWKSTGAMYYDWDRKVCMQ